MKKKRDLKYYIYNKSIAIILTILMIYISHLVFKNNIKTWLFLMLLLVVFGQGHFITTYAYLFPSLKRKLENKFNITIFLSFIILITFIFFYVNSFKQLRHITIAFIGGYFIFHNTINEKSMLQQSLKIKEKHAGLVTLFFLSLLMWVYTSTINTSSFSSLTKMNVVNLNSFIYYRRFISPARNIVPEWLILLFFLLSLFLLVYLFFIIRKEEKNYTTLILLAGIFICTYFLRNVIISIGFLDFMAFIISYHYVTWFLFYFYKFKQSAELVEKEKSYLLFNVLVYISLIGLALLTNISSNQMLNNVYIALFSLPNFLVWTFLHITITLINEPGVNRFFLIFK